MSESILPSRKIKNRIGERFGRFVVIAYAGPTPQGRAKWPCRCDCGTEKTVYATSLHNKTTLSCGCLHRENLSKRTTKHGQCGTPEYDAWKNMKARCYNAKGSEYHNYGGRGIIVCERWLHSFADFLADMGPRPPGKRQFSVERRDTNGNYEPGNCYRATWHQQSRNKRTNRLLTWNGTTKTITDWAATQSLTVNAVKARLRSKWPIDMVLGTPLIGKALPKQLGEMEKAKNAVRSLLREAIRHGRVIKPTTCQHPGCNNTNVQGFHSKGFDTAHALDVEWLCPKHRAGRIRELREAAFLSPSARD